ncbi:MAG TPA: DUF4203 domain-containing protein [Vicinamibacterales bacterium]|jgi:hypothetical protein|nr:DUF4203 domain-containing protein [Vicinamibacterales bacterium]
MLPASFQTPAAVLLLIGGLLACFAGYRIFRTVLAIYGFILGAMLASSTMGSDQTLWMIVAAIVGGLIGAVILVFAYFLGVALLGAGIGAFVAHLIWAALGRDPHLFIVILFAVAGALGALALQRYVIIGATSFAGAWTVIIGALTLARPAGAAPRQDVWTLYPFGPAPGERWVVFAWLVLGLVGAAVQVAITAKGRQRR